MTLEPDPKPLYLEPEAPLRIGVEGSALHIEHEDGRDQYLPLRRISRIIAHERVQFDTEALLKITRRGIPILIHSDEHPHARIVGPAPHPASLRQRFIDLLARPDWEDRYRDWQRAMHRRIATVLVHRLKAPKSLSNDPEALRNWIENQVERESDVETRRKTAYRFRQLNLAWMQQRLLRHGFGGEEETLLYDTIDLPARLGRLLDDRTQTIRLGWLRRRRHWAEKRNTPLPSVNERQIVRVYEKDAARIARLGDDIINRLHRWVVGIQ